MRQKRKEEQFSHSRNPDSDRRERIHDEKFITARRSPKKPDNYPFSFYIRIERNKSIGIDEYNT